MSGLVWSGTPDGIVTSARQELKCCDLEPVSSIMTNKIQRILSNTKAIQFSSSVQELMPQTKACNADMKHSDWLKIVVWLATSNHSALFQYSKCSAI